MRVLKYILCVLSFSVALPAFAQSDGTPNVSVQGAYTYVPIVDGIYRLLFDSSSCTTYNAQLGFNTAPDGGSPYAMAYNYPVYGFGINYSDYSMLRFRNDSHYGDTGALYAFFERPFKKTPLFMSGYILRLGLAYTGDHYDPFTNPCNHFLGTHLMTYVSAGLKFRWHIAPRLEAGGDLLFYHYSNGKMHMPNCGLNQFSAGAVITYDFGEPYWKQAVKNGPRDDFRKGIFWDISVMGGKKCLESEWTADNWHVDEPSSKKTEFTPVMRLGLGADLFYRYSLKCSSGISMDVLYTDRMDLYRRCDVELYGESEVDSRARYNNLSIGLGAAHQVHYDNFSMHVVLGAYLFQHSGIAENLGFLYQKIGFRYLFPSLGNTFVGFDVKSYEFCRADYLEFSIGIRI